MAKERRTKAELIGEVLKRIGTDRFEVDKDDHGEIFRVMNYGPTFEEMEDYLEIGQFEEWRELAAGTSEDWRDEIWGPGASLLPENGWNDHCTEVLLAQTLGLELKDASPIAKRLSGLPYKTVITRLYAGLTKILGRREDAKSVLDGRRTFTGKEIENLENELTAQFSSGLGDLLAGALAIELGGSFPRIVNRVEQLNTLPVLLSVPPEVRQYLREASISYLNGLFNACVMLCRSAIEIAIRQRLIRDGHGPSVSSLDESKQSGLDSLIELGRSKLPWRLGQYLNHADEVRRRANPVVHGTPISAEECRTLFEVTRTVLKEIYTVE